MIKGWSDVVRFPRLGEISLGQKDEKGLPKALDHFVVPPEVEAVYGKQPQMLDIMLPHEDRDVVMPSALKRYGDQWGLICRGDGKVATVSALYAQRAGGEYDLKADGERFRHGQGELLPVVTGDDKRSWVEIRCPYHDCPHYQAKRCREVVQFNFLLPKVAGVLGVYTITTGSYNSYTNLKNGVEMLRVMAGKTSFIPLQLKVRMQSAHPEVGDKRIRTTVPVMYIDITDMSLEQMMSLAQRDQLALVSRSTPVTRTDVRVELEPIDENQVPELLYPLEQSSDSTPATAVSDLPVEPPAPNASALPAEPANSHSAAPPPAESAGTGGDRGDAGPRRSRNRSGSRRENHRRTAHEQPTVGVDNAPGGTSERGAGQSAALSSQIAALARLLPAERVVTALGTIDPWHTWAAADAARLADIARDLNEQESGQLLRALAAQVIQHEAGGVPGLLEREVTARGITVPLEELDLDTLRELGRAVKQVVRRSGTATEAREEPSTRSGADGATGEGDAGLIPVRLTLTRAARRQEQEGRQIVTCQAIVMDGGNQLQRNLVVQIATQGPVGETLLQLRPGQNLQATARKLAASSLWLEEVKQVVPIAS